MVADTVNYPFSIHEHLFEVKLAWGLGLCYALLMNNGTEQSPERQQSAGHQQRSYSDQLGMLKSANALLHDLAWELEELQARLETLRAQRGGPTDILLEREINELERQSAALEDRLLQQMLSTDELVTRIADERRRQDSATPDPDAGS